MPSCPVQRYCASPLYNKFSSLTGQEKKSEKVNRTKMAKQITIALVASAALCLLSLLGSAHGQEHFSVEGKVYCDTCNTQFITRLTEYMKGAKVRLECKDREGGNLTFSEEAVTDETGTYRIEVDGDHEEEVCEVIPVESVDPTCSGISEGEFLRKAFRVSLTSNNGVVSPIREVNPIGFLKEESVPGCIDVLRELGFTETGGLLP